MKFIAGGFKKKPTWESAQQEVFASSWKQGPSAHLSVFALLCPQHQAETTECGKAEYIKDLGRRTVLGELDGLVSGDLVLRKAVQRAYGLPAMPTEKEAEALGEQWRSHRSLAARYLFDSMVPAHQKEKP